MHKRPFLFVANWKMQKTFIDSLAFFQEHSQEISETATPDESIIICPSFLCLSALSGYTQTTKIVLGAQDCSEYENGPFTGQIDARSLAQIGCTYCIVGHSERRAYESTKQILGKVVQLINNLIVPIVCIGQNSHENEPGQVETVLYEQIVPILDQLHALNSSFPLCIAYEPLWAIGTGKTPSLSHIQETIQKLHQWTAPYPFAQQITYLYGGSVTEQNITSIGSIAEVGGVLIGNASLDFKKLKNIVSLYTANKKEI